MEIREIPFQAMGGFYESDDVAAVTRIAESALGEKGNFFPLPEENDFQNRLARHEGAKKAIAVNSCGTALDCCMMALDIKEGDEVITTPLTFVCTAGTALARGARVVFADIDPVSLNLDPDRVQEMVTSRTKAIIPVHFSGLACDIDGFDRITAETGIPVIYDAAHAVGARYKGKAIGNRGRAACYSFQSNKNITCLGEGGAVTTDNEEFAENVRQLKTFGYVYGPSLRVVRIGFNYRMTKAQYAVGITQLNKVDRINELKRKKMLRLNKLLVDLPEIIRPPGIGPEHAGHLYVARLNTDKVSFSRDEFGSHLKNRYKVGTAVHYPPVWSWEAFQELGYNEKACPITAKICTQVISLPVFPGTSPDDLEYIAWAIKETVHNLKSQT